MTKGKINREKVIGIVKKMVVNKELVRSYLKGNISKEVLNEKGIKLANPL